MNFHDYIDIHNVKLRYDIYADLWFSHTNNEKEMNIKKFKIKKF